MRLSIALCTVSLACASSTTPRASAPVPAPAIRDTRHLLNRLTFGPRPGDVAAADKVGADAWLELQLHPERIPDRATEDVLAKLETQHKKAFELLADHPTLQELLPSLSARMLGDGSQSQPRAADSVRYRQAAATANALSSQIAAARVIRAAQSDRQLLEVMVDFWENHFSVNIAKSPNRYSILEYDRDVIRPNALGKFRDLLGAVAKSPQMLFYLDAWQSVVDSVHPTIAESRIEQRRAQADHPPLNDSLLLHVTNRRRTGLNENYARELLELHTMGVNGGYTQDDVIAVARCLTGWTIDSPQLGGPFLFRAEVHDAGEKTVLGVRIPAGGGITDGERVLDIVAKHPSTAHYIALKLVVRLVSDSAPPALVERAAQRFLATDGDIREVVRTIVTSPEFFAADAFRAKVKTPFELVVSTLRAMDATPDTTNRIVAQFTRLGQPLWGRLTPDGWPDHGDAWMNAGSLMNRVNFATAAATGNIPGVSVPLWTPTQQLIRASHTEQAQGVIDALLEGRASAETRDAIFAASDGGPADRRAPLARLVEMISVALSSPEFQHR